MKNVTYATLIPSPSSASQSATNPNARVTSNSSSIRHHRSMSSSTSRYITRSTTSNSGSPAPRQVVPKTRVSDLRDSVDLGNRDQQQLASMAHEIVAELSPAVDSTPPMVQLNESSPTITTTIERRSSAVNKGVARAASVISKGVPSPQLEPDDQVRRFDRYDIGVSMKLSVEASKMIYGRSPSAMEKISRASMNTLGKSGNQKEVFVRLGTPETGPPRYSTQANFQQKRSQPRRDTDFPPRKSSIARPLNDQAKDNTPQNKGQTFGYRLARPTAASAARGSHSKKLANAKDTRPLAQFSKPDSVPFVKRGNSSFMNRLFRRHRETTENSVVKGQQNLGAISENNFHGMLLIQRLPRPRICDVPEVLGGWSSFVLMSFLNHAVLTSTTCRSLINLARLILCSQKPRRR